MKKRISQFFSLVLVVVLMAALAIPVHADVSDAAGYVVGEFWDMMTGKEYDMYFDYWKNFTGYLVGEECPSSPDKYHHGNTPVGGVGIYGSGGTDDNGRFVLHVCDYCQREFKVYASDLQQSYDAQVEELPTPSITAAGRLIWQPVLSDLVDSEIFIPNSYYSIPSGDFLIPNSVESGFRYKRSFSDYSSRYEYRETYSASFLVPVSGSYSISPSTNSSFRAVLSSGEVVSDVKNYYSVGFKYYSEGSSIKGSGFICEIPKSSYAISVVVADVLFPIYEIIPDSAIDITSGDTYNIQSRPTSITGDYGIIGDNGQIIKVEGDKIVNETTNNYYNPATGETHTMSDWSYNYSDRSYTVTLEGGDTVSVTYGDENVVIQEGDTTYNVYYLVNGSGSETPGPGPEVCDHTWTETSRTEPTCTTAGKVTFTCSKCNQTKTETIPATGHSWAVDRTVQTTYDEEGNLLQQGYTIYSCSVCGEQYKDMEGTGPPGAEGEKSIWEKIGDFFGTIGGGFIDIINATLGKLLDALIALAEMLMDKLKAVVEAVLSIFEEVPVMFSGFLAFLTAIFPFLPPEIMTLLTFGIAAVVFIGIIKAIRR